VYCALPPSLTWAGPVTDTTGTGVDVGADADVDF
jgi:hypothetical protein